MSMLKVPIGQNVVYMGPKIELLKIGNYCNRKCNRSRRQDRFAGCQIDLAARQAARKIYKGKPFLCGKSSETPRNHILAI